jgi:hypothetical protein
MRTPVGNINMSGFPILAPASDRDGQLEIAKLIICNLVHEMGGSWTVQDADLVSTSSKFELNIYQSESLPGLLIVKVKERE